eukprot:TRINITY_DN7319_c1_g1_i2.p1 TRINITY_DN7319_c1_g1~~TRINITY_DN7319_c1_g1_i2.p1  ORF type:complete len:128 (-),score=35.08 TRINITY_DN7319_c1_g1_i2:81-464(-)
MSDERDINILVNGIKSIREKIKSSNLYTESELEELPDPKFKKLSSKNKTLQKFIKQTCFSIGSLAGSCKMGTKEDNLAVVDENLHVHGLKNLVIADSSVMPNITSGCTLAPTTMIAEKASLIIKNKY